MAHFISCHITDVISKHIMTKITRSANSCFEVINLHALPVKLMVWCVSFIAAILLLCQSHEILLLEGYLQISIHSYIKLFVYTAKCVIVGVHLNLIFLHEWAELICTCIYVHNAQIMKIFHYDTRVDNYTDMCWIEVSRIMTKPTKWHVCAAKTQISLGICLVWLESSLSAWRKLGS